MPKRALAYLRGLRHWLRVYTVPFVVCSAAATLYLGLISYVTSLVPSALVVMALVALPSILPLWRSAQERLCHWWEYALVILIFFVSIPLYGAILFVLGYGLVFARAWRREWPHPLQVDED